MGCKTLELETKSKLIVIGHRELLQTPIYIIMRNFRVLGLFMSYPSDEIQQLKHEEVPGSSYVKVLGSTKIVGPTPNFN
jgi:hypothetical protein